MMKKYRIEIQALYYKDVEADNIEEAKEMVKRGDSVEMEDGGQFFYEEFDFDKNMTIREDE
jgi:hypothetical protein